MLITDKKKQTQNIFLSNRDGLVLGRQQSGLHHRDKASPIPCSRKQQSMEGPADLEFCVLFRIQGRLWPGASQPVKQQNLDRKLFNTATTFGIYTFAPLFGRGV